MLDTALCSCGSGLRRIRCCGLDLAALPESESLTALDQAGDEATRLFNEKKTAEAEKLALRLLDLAPNHRLPLRVLYELRKSENKARATEVLARRLADLPAPNTATKSAANLQLAQLLISSGRMADAEAPARKALIAAPRDATVHHVMGVVLTETGDLRAGERHYRKATILLGRDDGTVLANTAWNLKLQGRLDEAAELYQRALALRPDNSRGIGGFAQVEMGRGRRDAAITLLDDGLRRWPSDRTLRLLRTLVDLADGQAAAALTRLDEPAESLLPAEFSARGQAYMLLEQPAEAVSNFAHGKKLQRERYGQAYTPKEFIDKSEAYKAYFTSDRLLSVPRAGAIAGPRPVFLLGFPRSGSSLLEQVLACVTGFALGDDHVSVGRLIDLVPRLTGTEAAYPQALDDLLIGDGIDVPERLRSRYQALREGGEHTGTSRFITDRSADNHWHLGLIKLLFPNAPILHVIRHPLDVMLSNLAQERKLEANCGVSLVALARHYDLTMSLIRHYRAQLTLRYLPVRYEALVQAPAATVAEVLGFIGPEAGQVPDEAVLRDNRAAANPVPQHFAVRETVHRRGLYRYRAYEAAVPNLFSEVRPILQPWIRELGYEDAP